MWSKIKAKALDARIKLNPSLLDPVNRPPIRRISESDFNFSRVGDEYVRTYNGMVVATIK